MRLPLDALNRLLPRACQSIGLASSHLFETDDVSEAESHGYFPDLLNLACPQQLDALVTDARSIDREAWRDEVRRLRLRLQPHGALLVITRPDAPEAEAIRSALERLGLRLFLGWRWGTDEADPTPLHAQGPSSDDATLVLRFQRANYSPLMCAREHLRAGHPGSALAILAETPEAWYTNDEDLGLHEAERLVCLLVHDRHAGPKLRHLHLVAALHAYNRACTLVPTHVPLYQCMAAFWRRVGRPDLSQGLLETVETILGTPPNVDSTATAPKAESHFVYPDFDPVRPPRLLFVCHPESDFGADVLFDGLRHVLGAENVVGFPWKPTLHGQDLDQAFGYPCTFHWPDGPVPLAQLTQELQEGRFDAMLYCDAHGTLPHDETRQLLDVAADLPIFLLDTWDECGDLREAIQERDGIEKVAGYFKREMIAGLDYGPNAWPLPFAFPDNRFADEPQSTTRDGLFWAGKLIGGARRLQLSWLQPQVPMTCAWGTQYSQEAYAALLRQQSVGLCFFGNGFDTVRYWELPAHGVMLLAERSPLVIPNNFEDGRQAVYFVNAAELLEKSRYYLAHPEEAAAIARAGHAHALGFHTGTARARQCLGLIQARMRELAND